MRAPKEVTLGGSRPAGRAAQGTPEGAASQGALFFGDFLLGKQKKITSRRAAPGEVEVAAQGTDQKTLDSGFRRNDGVLRREIFDQPKNKTPPKRGFVLSKASVTPA